MFGNILRIWFSSWWVLLWWMWKLSFLSMRWKSLALWVASSISSMCFRLSLNIIPRCYGSLKCSVLFVLANSFLLPVSSIVKSWIIDLGVRMFDWVVISVIDLIGYSEIGVQSVLDSSLFSTDKFVNYIS
jgi:hypothetical protein